MINFIKSIYIGIRPKTLSASIAPVLVGSAIAFKSSVVSVFDINIFFLTLLAAISIQIGTNFANDVYDFIKGADNVTRQSQKENMFFQMLEGLHESEAKLLINAKDKKLHQIYKGLSSNVVREAFGWDEDFVVPKPDVYPQASRSASGLVADA